MQISLEIDWFRLHLIFIFHLFSASEQKDHLVPSLVNLLILKRDHTLKTKQLETFYAFMKKIRKKK